MASSDLVLFLGLLVILEILLQHRSRGNKNRNPGSLRFYAKKLEVEIPATVVTTASIGFVILITYLLRQ